MRRFLHNTVPLHPRTSRALSGAGWSGRAADTAAWPRRATRPREFLRIFFFFGNFALCWSVAVAPRGREGDSRASCGQLCCSLYYSFLRPHPSPFVVSFPPPSGRPFCLPSTVCCKQKEEEEKTLRRWQPPGHTPFSLLLACSYPERWRRSSEKSRSL